ncbi:hypothetical protein BGZ76_000352 [Entomortierella beljakovae]|nr:hypothetical protein BGZ76_000352 [Entomortierella beljakovae]
MGKKESDKHSRCLLADITGDDSVGNQIFLAECSKIYEKDDRKFLEDRRKLAQAMKDSWDLAVRKLAEEHSRPHEELSCGKLALKFAAAIAEEIDERKKLETISPTRTPSLLRAARGFKRTTDS